MSSEKEEVDIPNDFNFPYQPYSIQSDFMTNLYRVIENKQLGIFESPTGTGKSLSIICGSLKWLHDHNQNEKDKLLNEIESLEAEQGTISDNSPDWFNTQCKTNKIKSKLFGLKAALERINTYENKIRKMQDAVRNIIKKNKHHILNKKRIDAAEKKFDSDDEESDKLIDSDLILADEEDENEEFESNSTEEFYEPIKIYICSRTHSQLSQLVAEIKKTSYKDKTRVITLASRQNYCINKSVLNLKNVNLMNQRCLDLQKQQVTVTSIDEDKRANKKQKGKQCRCPFYKKTLIEDLSNLALTDIQDVEDLAKYGTNMKACPYYASRKAAENAQLILVPYNTIIHESTRKANGIQLKNNIIIIDEAHNLLEAVVQMHHAELTYKQLFYAELQLQSYKTKFSLRFSYSNLLQINKLITVVTRLLKYLDEQPIAQDDYITSKNIINFTSSADISGFNFLDLVRFGQQSRLIQKIYSYTLKYPIQEKQNVETKKGIKQFLATIENKSPIITEANTKEEEPVKLPLNPLQSLLTFLEKLTFYYDDGLITTQVKKDKNERNLKFLLLNPSSQFEALIKEARSVIVAGGTMKPIEEFRKRLFQYAGASPNRIVEFCYDHVVKPENVLPLIISATENNEAITFNFQNRYSMGNILIDFLQTVCAKVNGGIIVFFPSYNYENWFWQKTSNIKFGRKIFREPQGSSNVDEVLQDYAKCIKNNPTTGALMFSVVGGKLSEGLNFSDDLGRCVIVVGLPYANITSKELNERMSYLDRTEGTGAGQQLYENLCIKLVNQCIGRAIRHRNDYATIILLDERYKRPIINRSLPGWIHKSLESVKYKEAFILIEEFFQRMGSC